MQAYDELPLEFPVRNKCTVLSSGNVEKLKAGYDLVYIDPPYISNIARYNRDDYWRRYHFLEGLAIRALRSILKQIARKPTLNLF